MGPATSTRSARAASLGAALTAAVLLALFPVWEQDWGWQVRAGEERLTSRRPLSGRDEWSYTARGAPWVDVQWAATSVMGAAHLTAGPGGLVALRAALSGLVALGAFASFRQSEAGGSSPASAPAALCVWALAFLAMRDRLQIRSEMFVFALGAWVPSLFAASPSASTLTMAVAVAAAANLHFGVAPFVACHACSLVLGEGLGAGAGLSPLVLRLLPLTFKCAATLLALLANPAPLYAARFFWHHVFYFRDKLLRNPDHVRASWASLAAPGGEEGASLWAWATATALAVWIYFGCLSGGLGRSLRPRGYQNPAVFVISVLTLSLGCLERVRIVPFAVLYLLPVLMAGAASLGWEKKGDGGGRSNREEKKKKKNARYMHPQAETLWWSLAAALLAVHFGIGQGVRVGFHLVEGQWPVASAEFVLSENLQGNIYHTFTFGNYLVYAFRGRHLTYGDTRETIFQSNEREYHAAYHSPQALRALLERHSVNTILTKIPGTQPLPSGEWRDIMREFTPPDEWAVLFWDDVSVVTVRRVPAHAAAIAAHEYTMLRPALPYNLFLRDMQSWTGEQVVRFRSEVLRCNARRGDTNLYCALCAAAWASVVADPLLPPAAALDFLDRLPPTARGHKRVRHERTQLEKKLRLGPGPGPRRGP